MAELTGADVESYTGGRLVEGEDETERLLAAALAAARRYCGWHVTPVWSADVLTVDGPGGVLLALPTLYLTALTAVVEDGTTLDVADLWWSVSGLVRKKCGRWSSHYRSIVATITHGYADAPDWDAAVLFMVDQMSQVSTGGGTVGSLVRKKVDDVEYQWSDTAASADSAAFNAAGWLNQYRILPPA